MHTLVSQKCWKFTHPQAIQDVNEFVSSLEQIWRNLALHHLLTNRLQWMGAVRMRVQTTDENITIIHNLTPVHQLMSCEVKSYMFKINKSIIKMFYCNFKPVLLAKTRVLHSIVFSREKSYCLNKDRNTDQALFTSEDNTEQF